MKDINAKKWDEQEIKKAARIMAGAIKKKSTLIKILDELVHWLLLVVVLFGNIIIGCFVVIASSLITNSFLYLFVILIATSFGLMIEIALRDIEKLSKQKHSFSRMMLIVLTLVNVMILSGVRNTLEYFLNIEFSFNATVAGAVYGLFFLAPHAVGWLWKNRKPRKEMK